MTYPPQPRPQSDNVSRVVCALIGVLAVLAAVVMFAVGNDSAATATVRTPGGAGGGGTSTGSDAGNAPSAGVSPSYLVDHFPVPPGQTDVNTSESADGTKTYDLDGTALSLRSFLGSRLTALGFTWIPIPNSTGYTGVIRLGPQAVGTLTLTPLSGSQARATVKITA